MRHTRGKPYHPMTQGKIERLHLSIKSTSCLMTTTCPATSSEPLPISSTATISGDITRVWTTTLPLPATSDAALECWNVDDTFKDMGK